MILAQMRRQYVNVGFEILTAVVSESLDFMGCSAVYVREPTLRKIVFRHFQPPASMPVFVRLIFDPENGSDVFRCNVGLYTSYTALYSRRWQLLLLNCIFNK
jgi:hypothetical protein